VSQIVQRQYVFAKAASFSPITARHDMTPVTFVKLMGSLHR